MNSVYSCSGCGYGDTELTSVQDHVEASNIFAKVCPACAKVLCGPYQLEGSSSHFLQCDSCLDWLLSNGYQSFDTQGLLALKEETILADATILPSVTFMTVLQSAGPAQCLDTRSDELDEGEGNKSSTTPPPQPEHAPTAKEVIRTQSPTFDRYKPVPSLDELARRPLSFYGFHLRCVEAANNRADADYDVSVNGTSMTLAEETFGVVDGWDENKDAAYQAWLKGSHSENMEID